MKNITLTLYVMGDKGHACLAGLVAEFGTEPICWVVSSRDNAVIDDGYTRIKEFCNSNKLRFVDRSEVTAIRDADASLCFAVGWRWMIPHQRNLIVFHDSILPKYRGFAPLVNMLKNGEQTIGVTAICANDKYDEGHVVGRECRDITYPIKIREAISIVSQAYSVLAVRLFREYCVASRFIEIPQDDSSATYSVWLDDNDYFVDWNDSAESIRRFVDATGEPYQGARAYLNGQRIRIRDVEARGDVCIEQRTKHLGKILFVENGVPIIICGSGLLAITNAESLETSERIKSFPFRSRFC